MNSKLVLTLIFYEVNNFVIVNYLSKLSGVVFIKVSSMPIPALLTRQFMGPSDATAFLVAFQSRRSTQTVWTPGHSAANELNHS